MVMEQRGKNIDLWNNIEIHELNQKKKWKFGMREIRQ